MVPSDEDGPAIAQVRVCAVKSIAPIYRNMEPGHKDCAASSLIKSEFSDLCTSL